MSDLYALSQVRALFAPIHRDGYKFVAIAAAVTLAAFLLSATLGLIALFITLALALFFRDPRRIVPVREGLIIAAADGMIIGITSATPPPELGLGRTPLPCISTFLSLFDVHVIRTPAAGRVGTSFYKPGQHHNAGAPEASVENECHGVLIEMKEGQKIGAVLIAGRVARRIITSISEGDSVSAGERIGIIRFGSRVDLYLPASAQLLVAAGQRVIAGETVIADLDSHETPRIFQQI